MDSAIVVAERIIKLLPGATNPVEGVAYNIQHFAADFAHLCKNIKETSVGEADRNQRCIKLAADSGVDYYLIDKLTS